MYICPCCKKEVQPGAVQCIHCGVRFAPADNAAVGAVTQAPNQNSPSSGSGWKAVSIVLSVVLSIAVTVGAVFGFRYIYGTEYDATKTDIPSLPESSYEENVFENSSESVEETEEYMLYGSDSRYITRSELVGMSEWELRVARNEIYARHGRKFKDAALQAHFDSQIWYYGYISSDSFDDKVLNKYEKANLKVIVDYEKEMGYR